jgi:Leucine-rich repeat (LRR) protein
MEQVGVATSGFGLNVEHHAASGNQCDDAERQRDQMPSEQKIIQQRGENRRDYVVFFEDDSPERAEAVKFFQKHADRLLQKVAIPSEVENLPMQEANAYLRKHPIQEQWWILTIGPQSAINDADLARLQNIPEIDHVKVYSDKITDAGVKHILHLNGLKHLVLCSKNVTDECLKDIQTMPSLVSLDLQGASGVSRTAVLNLVNKMPWLQDAWPPADPAHLAKCQRRARLSQVGRSDPNQVSSTVSTQLRFVDLSRKKMVRPPDELFATDDIRRLDFIDCGLESLPDTIGNLTQLRTLYANWCRLTEIPATFGKLTALESLWLNDNFLTGLPDCFSSLTCLKELCLDTNQLMRFPTVIFHLKRLENLRITNNRLVTLPEEIGELAELRNLSLGHNQLRTLPRSIYRLEKLTYLGLQGNPLESLPDDVWRLPCLITLNLAHTGLTQLPKESTNIPNIIGLPGRRVHS